MSAFLSPIGGAGSQFFDNQGRVLAGGKLYSYRAGSTTPTDTWTTPTQTTRNANPIILDSAGRPPNEVWLAAGVNNYKFVLTDSDGFTLGSWDNISAINGPQATTLLEWVANGFQITYINPSQFSVSGDQRSIFPINRRVQYILSAGAYYGYVASVAFDGTNTTTVTIISDTLGLDSSVSAVNHAALDSAHPSIPQNYVRQGQPLTVSNLTATNANITNLTSSNVNITGGSISGVAGLTVPDYLFKNGGII